jgi:hypothetical protein
LLLCQTFPTTGQCLDGLGPSFTLNFDAGAINTFTVYVFVDGPIPLAPASSRIFLRFKDANGGLHGSISVAVAVAAP